MLPDIGLYYPYIHFRSDAWLKTAALYWPHMARVVPGDYALRDSRTVRALADDLGFITAVGPARTAEAVAPVFLEVIERYGEGLSRLYGRPGRGLALWQSEPQPHAWPELPAPNVDSEPRAPFAWSPEPGQTWEVPAPAYREGDGRGTPALAGLSYQEVAPALRTALYESGLAVEAQRSRFGRGDALPWVAMAAPLVWVYKCVFTEHLARAGGYAPTTDQEFAHMTSDDWTAERIARVLVGGQPGPPPSEPEGPEGGKGPGRATAMAMLAVEIVVPADIARVPVEKIVKLRTDHRAEFDAFTAAVSGLAAELHEDLATVVDPESRELRLRLAIRNRLTTPLDELRKAMRGLRFSTAVDTLTMKVELPSAVTAVAGSALVGEPVVGGIVGGAIALAGVRRAASRQRQELLRGSPVAYLLALERGLRPAPLLRRLAGNA
ncbi:DUF6236 family protein [Streptomyces daliensis]|uniref:Uncharacterized protein n=1 Tax=Streptomyces daliensis TaxID=299421 RepID=A0A8T4IQ87_9ACTN|nr:hypothetical protein [Streptomyces daliensis]